MTDNYFTPSREDGRSDARVVYDMTFNSNPGDFFSHDDIEGALLEGLEDEALRDGRRYAAVGSANRRLLREHSRYLAVVRGRGYRMVAADEHLPLAIQRKERASSQLKRGVALLRHARLDELDDNQRRLHEAQLMILGAVAAAIDRTERQQKEQSEAIGSLRKRVEGLESALSVEAAS